jgi:hypothetical protein
MMYIYNIHGSLQFRRATALYFVTVTLKIMLTIGTLCEPVTQYHRIFI